MQYEQWLTPQAVNSHLQDIHLRLAWRTPLAFKKLETLTEQLCPSRHQEAVRLAPHQHLEVLVHGEGKTALRAPIAPVCAGEHTKVRLKRSTRNVRLRRVSLGILWPPTLIELHSNHGCRSSPLFKLPVSLQLVHCHSHQAALRAMGSKLADCWQQRTQVAGPAFQFLQSVHAPKPYPQRNVDHPKYYVTEPPAEFTTKQGVSNN
eukprot:3622910-Amphidinium_carterae.1